MAEDNKKKTLKIAFFLIVVFFIIYIPSFFNWIYGQAITTQVLYVGTIEDSVNTEGFLVRGEELLKSPIEGKYEPSVGEGEKVPANYKVVTVLKENAQELQDKMSKLDMNILEAQKKKNENLEIFSPDFIKIDDEIGKLVKQLVRQNSQNSFEATKPVEDNINNLIKKKTDIIGSMGGSDNYINSLIKDKNSLADKIKAATQDIYSKSAGVISFSVDGYEEILTPPLIKNLTPKALNEINTKVEQKNKSNKVEVSKPFAKIVKNIEGYIVVVLPNEKAKEFKVDDTISLRINNINKIVTGVIDYKSNEEDGKEIISIKINTGISETISYRKVSLDLVRNYYKGLKVPLSSLLDIDYNNMTAKIFINKNNYAVLTDVKIMGKNDEFAIIDNQSKEDKTNIALYSSFLINPRNIKDGQVIEK